LDIHTTDLRQNVMDVELWMQQSSARTAAYRLKSTVNDTV